MKSLKRKIKKFNSTFFFKNFLFYILLVSESYSQSISSEIHFLDNIKKPFWISSNNNGAYSSGSIIRFKISEESEIFKYDTEVIFPINQNEPPLFNQLYLKLNNNNFYIQIGKKSNRFKFNTLSSGSLVESSNAEPIPKILFGNIDYRAINFFNMNFQYSIKIGHSWIKSPEYIKDPFLHEKSLYIRKNISENSSFKMGLNHMAIWAGETKNHGKQPSEISDFFRIIFALPGSENSIKEEQKNSLGNHIGAWTFSYEKKYKDMAFMFYLEHPFEDESGARWLLNEFDGLYGININQKEASYISNFTYEYLNTMDQSGSSGASDSTYGWDNYYNHYLYQSGWTNNGRVIGNPLFTLGTNIGRYSDGNYIINNRLKAHHFGFQGQIFKKIYYKTLFTYSQNFGIYPDEDYFKSKGLVYRFDGGLIQRSGLIELMIKNIFSDVDLSLGYGFDNGELLYKTDSFMLNINHKFEL